MEVTAGLSPCKTQPCARSVELAGRSGAKQHSGMLRQRHHNHDVPPCIACSCYPGLQRQTQKVRHVRQTRLVSFAGSCLLSRVLKSLEHSLSRSFSRVCAGPLPAVDLFPAREKVTEAVWTQTSRPTTRLSAAENAVLDPFIPVPTRQAYAGKRQTSDHQAYPDPDRKPRDHVQAYDL